jgi:threonine dehydrogenase-like Zn-dependent dehydrogenase
MELTKGAGVDKVIVAGGGVESFEAMIKALKPGGKIGNVNYLGSGDYVTIPRVEWGCGMGHKQIVGGLMPGGRLRLQKLASLVECGKLNVKHLITHRFEGFEKVEDALMLMKDKPADLIKPVVKISD